MKLKENPKVILQPWTFDDTSGLKQLPVTECLAMAQAKAFRVSGKPHSTIYKRYLEERFLFVRRKSGGDTRLAAMSNTAINSVIQSLPGDTKQLGSCSLNCFLHVISIPIQPRTLATISSIQGARVHHKLGQKIQKFQQKKNT